jgi:hypothetical protein
MGLILESIEKHITGILEEKKKKWSGKISSKVEVPEGTFIKSASSIARFLKKNHDTLKAASSALSFFVNRQGKNLSKEDKAKFDLVREKLAKLYDEKKDK